MLKNEVTQKLSDFVKLVIFNGQNNLMDLRVSRIHSILTKSCFEFPMGLTSLDLCNQYVITDH